MSNPDHDIDAPFRRVIKMMEPLNLPDDMPLRDALPGVWPTWGEFKAFMEGAELLRKSLYADGALRQFVRLAGPTLRAAGCNEAAERLSELIVTSDAAREPLRTRGIFTNG